MNRRFYLLFSLAIALSIALPVRALPPGQPSTPPQLAQAAIPPLPAAAPAPFTPALQGIDDLAATSRVAGLGYLQPSRPPAAASPAAWLRDIALPLYVAPDGDHWGWIYQGWLMPNGQSPFAIGRDAAFVMVRTAPNLLAFPVLEQRDDGWMRVQYTDGGSAWVHADQLGLGETELSVTPWGDLLAGADRVQFQQAVASQVLRSQPELNRNVISLVSADSLIEPLEVSGDWVKVKVTSPVDGCRVLSGADSEEGWMRWRSEGGDVLLWQGESCS